jgi:hypothetical protein
VVVGSGKGGKKVVQKEVVVAPIIEYQPVKVGAKLVGWMHVNVCSGCCKGSTSRGGQQRSDHSHYQQQQLQQASCTNAVVERVAGQLMTA